MKILKYIIEKGGYDEKKIISFYICLSLCGCNNTSKIKGNTRKVVIPYSFSLLCGQTSEKDLNKNG
ncbi:hypothetical protein [Faecalibacillus faecis]|uniref:hypothetical protein n=1 Tax=Faecalibacillus faecis TaxID=1982628 RepID=UPI0035205A04